MPDDRFRILVEHAPVCIHEIDLDGRLTAMNPAGLAMMGVEDEAAVCGMPYLDAVGEADRPRVALLLQQALKHGAAHFEFTSAGEDPRVFASNFIPIRNADGDIAKLMGVTRDVTTQRRAESDLRTLNRELESQVEARTADLSRLNEQLRNRNRELDAFAQAVSHDLKSPLMTVTSYAELIKESLTQPEQVRRLERVSEAALRMASMIDELLELAQVGEHPAEPTAAVDLEAVLAEVRRDLDAEVGDTDAQVSHGPLPSVPGAWTEQYRLLQNLIGNALKFHGEQPLHVRVTAEREADAVAVSVTDNGRGIAPEHLDAIFSAFTRVEVAPDRPGTGIGLALCKRLVEARGGTLKVQSIPGRGSTFTYTIPIAGST